MPRSRTSAVPRESHHCDSSVLASVTLTTSPTAFMLLTMLTASGICVSPVAYVVLCVRFVSLVRLCRSLNRLQRSAGHATLDTGGWLDLMKTILCLPVRDFHPERNDKLRLPHQRKVKESRACVAARLSAKLAIMFNGALIIITAFRLIVVLSRIYTHGN